MTSSISPNTLTSSDLTSQEENMMEQITQKNKLMRRKLQSELDSASVEHKSRRSSSRRVPVRVYVKDGTDVLEMRKKIDNMEKLQNMYKDRINELETQVCNFSSFNAGQGAAPIRPRSVHKLPSNPPSGGSSASNSQEEMIIPVQPMITGLTASQVQQQDYSRVSSRPHPERTKLLALYDYTPQPTSKGRIAFKEGDVLLLVSMKSRSGWWLAELNGETGKIPSNYVEQLDPSRAFKARVIKNYDANQQGDLSIQRGSLITILKRQDNGWYLGERGNKTGFFPSSYVERITTTSS